MMRLILLISSEYCVIRTRSLLPIDSLLTSSDFRFTHNCSFLPMEMHMWKIFSSVFCMFSLLNGYAFSANEKEENLIFHKNKAIEESDFINIGSTGLSERDLSRKKIYEEFQGKKQIEKL